MVNPFRARRTEDTQKGPGGYSRVRGALRRLPIKYNPPPLQIYVKDFWFETWMSPWADFIKRMSGLNQMRGAVCSAPWGEVASIE